ncbi:hypothetical protein L195_g006224 [Trifolium pratense]|uniref:Uncharacterized protein n=1 Tax=Trifolium pratense TaxID=57577 RepID=A0A2K3P334_TRIPR|nr:hypothetical protein L195_g006224 [Trifolium pratense]
MKTASSNREPWFSIAMEKVADLVNGAHMSPHLYPPSIVLVFFMRSLWKNGDQLLGGKVCEL